MTDNADGFLRAIFDGAQGVVVTCSSEDHMASYRWRPGASISGRQTYFCISTVQDPNSRQLVLQRRAGDLVETCCIVLDDIGTKVDVARIRLAPSWKLETSPGNFQWGYILAEPATPERAAALVEALARAGLTDMGSRRADRVMRLPGSLNLKYVPPFEARLVEWTGRHVTYSELAAGLNVVPADTAPLGGGPSALPAGLADPVVPLLHELGLVLGPANPRGWIPIACPLETEHSGEIDHGTDYLPGFPGVFKCMHSHGDRLGAAWFRTWLAGQRPDTDLSAIPREALEAIGAKLAAALGVARPEGTAVETATAEGAVDGLFARLLRQAASGTMFDRGGAGEATAEDAARVRAEILDDLVHVASEDGYWSVSGRTILRRASVDDVWLQRLRAGGLLDSITPAGNPTVIAPHVWLRRQADVVRVAGFVHRLGEPTIIGNMLNKADPLPAPLWTGGPVDAPTPWLGLIQFICKDNPVEAAWLLDWMAMVVSAWDEKPGWHVLIRGRQGTGKNLAIAPIEAYCQPHHWVSVDPPKIASGFNSFLTARLILVDELKMNTRGSTTLHDIYNTVKAWTTRTAQLHTINEKFKVPYQAANRSAWVLISNEGQPLPLDDDDRRFGVFEPPWDRKPKPWYEAIAGWLEHGGNAVVIAWLQARWAAMTAERRKEMRGDAPATAAKTRMIDGNAEGLHNVIRLAVGGRYGEAWPDLVSVLDVFNDLRDPVHMLVSEQARRQLTPARVAAAMEQAGCVRLRDGEQIRERKDGGRRQLRLWCTRRELVPAYEAMPDGDLLDRHGQQWRAYRSPGGMRQLIVPVKD